MGTSESDGESQDVATDHASVDQYDHGMVGDHDEFEGGSLFTDSSRDEDLPPVLQREQTAPSSSGRLRL